MVAVLDAAAAAAGVTVWRGASLRQVEPREGCGFNLRLRLSPGLAPAGASSDLSAARLLLATGGHPSGRQLASQLGHGV